MNKLTTSSSTTAPIRATTKPPTLVMSTPLLRGQTLAGDQVVAQSTQKGPDDTHHDVDQKALLLVAAGDYARQPADDRTNNNPDYKFNILSFSFR